MKKSKSFFIAGFCLVFSLNISVPSFAELKWVDISGENFAADTFWGVDALYTESYNSGSDTTYSCAAYVKKFYSEVFGVDVYNLMDEGPPLLRDIENSFEKVETPKPMDIVFWPTSANKNNHSAIVKEVKGNTVYIIEQNYKTGTKAGVGREISYPSDSFVFYRLKNSTAPNSSNSSSGEKEANEKVNIDRKFVESVFDFYSEGNIEKIKQSGRVLTDDDEDFKVYEMETDEKLTFIITDKNVSGYYLDEDKNFEEIPFGEKVSTTHAYFAVKGYQNSKNSGTESEISGDESEEDETEENSNDEFEKDIDDADFSGGNEKTNDSNEDIGRGGLYEDDDEKVLSETYEKLQFPDVLAENWAYESINKCILLGYFKGYDDGNFKPFKTITRGEFAVLISKLLNREIGGNTFESYLDVHSSDWYYTYVESSKGYFDGKVNSTGDNVFLPMENAKREDICIAAIKAKGFSVANANLAFLRYFSDADSISDEAKPYVALAVEKKIVNGFEDGTFRPKESITRAQAAVILSKISEN